MLFCVVAFLLSLSMQKGPAHILIAIVLLWGGVLFPTIGTAAVSRSSQIEETEMDAKAILLKVAQMATYNKIRSSYHKGNLYTLSTYQLVSAPKQLFHEKFLNQLRMSDVETSPFLTDLHVLETYSRFSSGVGADPEQTTLGIHSTLPPDYAVIQQAVLAHNFSLIHRSIYDEPFASPEVMHYYSALLDSRAKDQDGATLYTLSLLPKRESPKVPIVKLTVTDQEWQIVQADVVSEQAGSIEKYILTSAKEKDGVYRKHHLDIELYVRLGKVIAIQKTEAQIEPDPSQELISFSQPPSFTQRATPRNIKQYNREVDALLSEQFRYRTLCQQEPLGKRYHCKRDVYRQPELFWIENRLIKPSSEKLDILQKWDEAYPPMDREYYTSETTLLSGQPKKEPNIFKTLSMGGTLPVSKSGELKIGGLAGVIREYNLVDGFTLGQKVGYSHRNLTTDRVLNLSADFRYGLSSHKSGWHLQSNYLFSPMNRGILSAEIGTLHRDINRQHPADPLWESLSIAFLGRNVVRWYRSSFWSLSIQRDLFHGFLLKASVTMDKRHSVANHTDWNLFKREVQPNMPEEWEPIFPHHQTALLSLEASYTPNQIYKIEGKTKVYQPSHYPTLSLGIDYAPLLKGELPSSHFMHLSGGIQQSIPLDLFSTFNYHFKAGGYTHRGRLYYPDYQFIKQSFAIFTTRDLYDTFNVLPYYTAANHFWVQAHAGLISEYILINRLPVLRKWGLTEGLHLHYLHMDGQLHHLEGGYSFGFGNAARVGLFLGVNTHGFAGVNFKVSLPFILRLFE